MGMRVLVKFHSCNLGEADDFLIRDFIFIQRNSGVFNILFSFNVLLLT